MPQAMTVSRLETASHSSAEASSLLSSWPQAPRRSYALESIGQRSSVPSQVPVGSRASAVERRSPYPSLRYTRSNPPPQSASRHEHSLHTSTAQQNLRAPSSGSMLQSNETLTNQSRHDTSTRHTQSPPTPKDTQHKVYLLNCKHCGNFLSDRGMKAVLLLKPNITLYSTDIVPTTCGPYYTPSTFHGDINPAGPPVERTCDCLTQTLGCYGCGAQVGYNIISPCVRCTNSVMKHQRSSNGHRTVLHCSEISVRERRYVCGEPGVRAVRPQPSSECFRQVPLERTRMQPAHSELYRLNNASRQDLYLPDFAQTLAEDDDPEAEKTELGTTQFQHQQRHVEAIYSARPRNGSVQAHLSEDPTCTRFLRRGDALFWSDLVSGGERSQPFDPDPILSRPAVYR